MSVESLRRKTIVEIEMDLIGKNNLDVIKCQQTTIVDEMTL